MKLKHIKAGHHLPDDINVIIEISAHSLPVKYEVDKKSGMLSVDRIISTSMCYPCNYGFIPHTLSEDGDPLDVLVITPYPLQSGSLINCRPVGLLQMIDDAGPDAKILAVPVDKITPIYKNIQQPNDLGTDLLETIVHFFQHYKDLEPGKWVKTNGWANADAAQQEILASVERYNVGLH